MATNDGGPAFPTPAGHATVEDWHPGHGEVRRTVEVCRAGMSLRDWFAGQALAGMLAANDPDFKREVARDVFRALDDTVTSAYAFADAMLSARAASGEVAGG